MTSSSQLKTSAPVMEVFASFQGEGRYVGEPQVFLRLAGCPLRCRWCDTPGSWAVRDGAHAMVRRDGEAPAREDRWASPFQAALWIAGVEAGEPRTLSVTGGEPLMWVDFIRALKPMLGGRRVHLETAGAHPEALARVLDVVDHVSLDLKLPSDMDTPVPLDGLDGDAPGRAIDEEAPQNALDWELARRRCLDLVRDIDACAKVVVTADRSPRDFDPLFEDVARRAPELTVFLTPATPSGAVRETPSYDHMVEVAEHARDTGLDVRVLPQVHRALGIA